MTDIAAQERARIEKISAHPLGKTHSRLVDMLCDADYPAEMCLRWLDAAQQDFANALQSVGRAGPAVQPKSSNGSMAIGAPQSTEGRFSPAAMRAGWSKAVATANRQAETLGPTEGGDEATRGWSKAIARANRVVE